MNTAQRAVRRPLPNEIAERLLEFEDALEQQRQFRLDQLDELAKAAADTPVATDDPHCEITQILRTTAAVALVEAEDALGRLRAGTYGVCERCTTYISCARLEILPMSRCCMRCQHSLETRPA